MLPISTFLVMTRKGTKFVTFIIGDFGVLVMTDRMVKCGVIV